MRSKLKHKTTMELQSEDVTGSAKLEQRSYTDKWTNVLMDKRTNGQTDKRTNGQIDKWTNVQGQTDKWTNMQMNKWKNESTKLLGFYVFLWC